MLTKRLRVAGAASFLALVAVSGFAAVAGQVIEECTATLPKTAGTNVGFELIDLMRREAWVTTDWTVEEYAEFRPGPAALNWSKNDPRIGTATRTSVLRSPGCEVDGKFTLQAMYDRTFFHIADITEMGGNLGQHQEIREAKVEKYHSLHFEAGQTVSVLQSSDGAQFVLVNRPVDVSVIKPALPDGWAVSDLRLQAAWQADLFGVVRVLRLESGDSYQGPIVVPDNKGR